MRKNNRHKLIFEAVLNNRLSNHGEIVNILKQHGLTVTQASISRDLNELGIAKVNGVYRVASNAAALPYGQIKIESAGSNLLVLKCGVGMASATAVLIDNSKIEGIVGTIAGDDTIFVAVTDESASKKVTTKILEISE